MILIILAVFSCFLVYVILEAFAGLESRRVTRGDFDFSARLRVFAFSCFSFTRFKSSEADKLNLVVLLYGILYSVNKCVQCVLGVFFWKVRFFSHCRNRLWFVHRHTSSSHTVSLYHRISFLAIHTDDFCCFERKIAFVFLRKAKNHINFHSAKCRKSRDPWRFPPFVLTRRIDYCIMLLRIIPNKI